MTNSPFAKLDVIMQHYKDLGCKGVGEIMPTMALDDPGLPMPEYSLMAFPEIHSMAPDF